jgi:hypothetical protein
VSFGVLATTGAWTAGAVVVVVVVVVVVEGAAAPPVELASAGDADTTNMDKLQKSTRLSVTTRKTKPLSSACGVS